MEEQLPDAEPVPPEEPVGAVDVADGASNEGGEEDPRLLPRRRVVEPGQQLPQLAVRRVPRRRAPLQERVRRRRRRLMHGRGDAAHGDRELRWEDRER